MVVEVIEREAFFVYEEEDVKRLAEGWHFHFGVVAVSEENVAFSVDKQAADFVQPIVFQQYVEDDFVESGVMEFFFGLRIVFQSQFFEKSLFSLAFNGRIDFQDVGVELNEPLQGQ